MPPPWLPQRGVLHFLGGAFAGAAPHWTYRRFLSALSARGFWVIATPLATSFDHLELVDAAVQGFERSYDALIQGKHISPELPVYGVGHSLGALLTALVGCGAGRASPEDSTPSLKDYRARLGGQALISYNAQSLAGAVPGWREFWTNDNLRGRFGDLAERLDEAGKSGLADAASTALDVSAKAARVLGLEGSAAALGGGGRVKDLYAPLLAQLPPLLRNVSEGVREFSPPSTEVLNRVSEEYPAELRALLVRFTSDPIDQTPELQRALKQREAAGSVELVELRGMHASPNFLEPLEPVDGTDALGRAALDAASPLDALLLGAGGDLTALVDALDKFLPPADGEADMEPEHPPLVQLRGLDANAFRHPLDRRQTRALERIPGLSGAVRQVVGIVEEVIYQDNVSSSVLVGERQYAWLHSSLCRACKILDIPEAQRPQVYVRQNPTPNAYTLAVWGQRPFVVVHTALLDICSEAEVEAVLAHELGHLKCEHGVWLSAANVLLLGASALPLPARVLVPLLERLQEELGTWQRAAELTCDRAALLVAQDPWVALSVLVKLSGGGIGKSSDKALPREQLEAFLDQAQLYDDARSKVGPLTSMIQAALNGGRIRTHPIPVLRARELRRWADSEQYQKLILELGSPMREQEA